MAWLESGSLRVKNELEHTIKSQIYASKYNRNWILPLFHLHKYPPAINTPPLNISSQTQVKSQKRPKNLSRTSKIVNDYDIKICWDIFLKGNATWIMVFFCLKKAKLYVWYWCYGSSFEVWPWKTNVKYSPFIALFLNKSPSKNVHEQIQALSFQSGFTKYEHVLRLY